MYQDTLVMIPGPTPVLRSIQEEMGREIQAFGDPRFINDYKALIEGLGALFHCSGKTFPLAGTGTLAMEMAIANSTKRGDHVLIVSNGFFGDRFIDICERKGLVVDVLQAEWGTCVPVDEIQRKLREKHYAAMTVSHVDTSTGVRAPIDQIGALMQEFPDTIYIVDGVAATAAEFADMDGMHIDIMFTGSQKAFGVCPGMLILWASQKALARRKALGTIPEYYVDFEKWLPIMDDPAKYFATPAVNLVWALKKSMELIAEEGLKARYERHEKNAHAAQKAFEALGFTILARPECRAVTLSNLIYPNGIDDAQFRSAMLKEGVVIAGALASYAGKACRIGHMGNVASHDMIRMLGAVERSLNACGYETAYGTGIGVYLEEMGK